MKHQNLIICEVALQIFRDKAVGQNLKDFEVKVKLDIAEKFKIIKQKCMKIYEGTCKAIIDPQIQSLEAKLK